MNSSHNRLPIFIKRQTAPQLANGIFASNSVAKDFLVIDFLYNSIITKLNREQLSHGHSKEDIHVIASIILDKEIVEELHKQLTEYLNYANHNHK